MAWNWKPAIHCKISNLPCFKLVKNWVQYTTTMHLGIVWRESIKVNKHIMTLYNALFNIAIIVSKLPLIFTFTEFIKPLMHQLCLLLSEWPWRCVLLLSAMFWLHVLLSFQTIPRAFEVYKFSARLEYGQQTPLRVHGYLTFLSLHRTANVTKTFHVLLFTRNVHESIELIFMISFILILEETLIIVSADHSHVFTMAGYPQRGNPIFGLATERGETEPAKAKDGLPYTVLGYANGPGGKRINGTRQNLTGVDTADKDYLQQATVWRGSETHAGDDVGALQ